MAFIPCIPESGVLASGRLKCTIAAMVIASLVMLGVGLPASVLAQDNQTPGNGQFTFFLTDPELGVVGAYRDGGQIFFFEARRAIILENETPVLDVYARIVDSGARAIALAASGPDLPEGWELPQNRKSAARTAAVEMAQPMMTALEAAGIDPAFELEQSMFVQLVEALAVQRHTTEAAATLSTAPIFGDTDSQLSEIVGKTQDYLSGLQQELAIHRSEAVTAFDRPHRRISLAGSFRGIQFEAFRDQVEDHLADGVPRMRVEVYSRFFNEDGQISASFGGHDVPAGWGWLEEEAEPDRPPKKRFPRDWPKPPRYKWNRNAEREIPSLRGAAADGLCDLFADLQKIGDTITAARAIEHARLDFMDAEKASLVAQAVGLRHDMLPKSAAAAISGEDGVLNSQALTTASSGYLWRKVSITLHYTDVGKVGPIPIPPGLPFGTHHSATRVSKWYWDPSGRYLRYYGSINLCNHGPCPYGKDMRFKCSYWSPYFWSTSWDERMPKYTTAYGGGTYHSCLTNYNIFSGAFGTRVKPTGKCWVSILGHNCNDDTKTQLRYVKGEKPGLCKEDCNNTYGRFECPSCN